MEVKKLVLILGLVNALYFPETFGRTETPHLCREILGQIDRSEPFDWVFHHRSTWAHMANSLGWLLAVQGVRTLVIPNHPFFTDALTLTILTDLGLTMASHAASLVPKERVRRFFRMAPQRKELSSRIEFALRTGVNIAIGSVAILASWGLKKTWATDFEIRPVECAAAVGLCTVVYPSLQMTKTWMFVKKPLSKALRKWSLLENDPVLGPAADEWMKVAEEKTREFGVKLDHLPGLLLNFLRHKILSDPTTKNRVLKEKQRLAEILKREPDNNDDLRFRLALYEILLSYENEFQRWKWSSAFFDAFLSVGVAGGVGLYYLNEWAIR